MMNRNYFYRNYFLFHLCFIIFITLENNYIRFRGIMLYQLDMITLAENVELLIQYSSNDKM